MSIHRKEIVMKQISFKKLVSAHADVQRELRKVGLSGSKLDAVEVFHCNWPQLTMPLALGFFIHRDFGIGKMIGYRQGHIYIPRWVFSSGHCALRDIIRHEYAHALVYHYRDAVMTAAFPRTFKKSSHGNSDGFITPYAAKCPEEDFAETFMVFVRRVGKPLPPRRNEEIRRKYQFVGEVIDHVSRSELVRK